MTALLDWVTAEDLASVERMPAREQDEVALLLKSFAPQPAPCAYQTSFTRFLSLLHTVDEARAGEVRPWPMGDGWSALWRDWESLLLTQSLLFVGKTRRVMATNVALAWDIWIAAGGVDPRWDVLTRSTERRLVLLQSQKLDGEGGSASFVRRIDTMIRLASDRGLREHWPAFPEHKWGWERGVEFAHGGRIVPVPQGANQVRGAGTTLLHMEEVQSWEEAEATIGTAVPALSGTGHMLCICTPRIDSYAAEIRAGRAGMRR